jgi:hypothetical protein
VCTTLLYSIGVALNIILFGTQKALQSSRIHSSKVCDEGGLGVSWVKKDKGTVNACEYSSGSP